MTNLLIILNKLITLICKIFKKNGSVFPASIVLKIKPDILGKIKYPKYVIGITGSSGKGSTTSLVAHILDNNGYKVVWNKSGSNVLNGTATLILNHCNFITRKLKADIVLLEMDESYIKETFKKSTLTHLLVTNVTRDQPARNGNPEIILDKIINSIDDKTHLILNADDSLVNRITLKLQRKITTYGINKTSYSITEPYSQNLDGAYCPRCQTKLEYRYYHYGHLGDYKCPSCDYKRNVNYVGKQVNLNKQTMIIENNKVHLNNNVFFAAYYTLAAYTLCKEIGLTEEQLLKALNTNIIPSKRLKTIMFDNREVVMIESKNENNLSYLQSLKYINQYPKAKTIILGFENVSRRYKYNDISWLYDVDFSILDTKNIDRIFCIGRFRFDVAARLINSGIDPDELILVDDISRITTLLKENSSGKIFTMVCFDMTETLKNIFLDTEEGDHNEN